MCLVHVDFSCLRLDCLSCADRELLWVECGTCTRWYHGACAGATQEDLDALGNAEWECPECQISR